MHYPIDIDALLAQMELDDGLTFQGDGFAYVLRSLLKKVNYAYEKGFRDARGEVAIQEGDRHGTLINNV